jgi:hypothetical protein
MSSMENGNTVVAAWETGGQVYWTRISPGGTSDPIAAPGLGMGRKHPRLALNNKGEVLLVGPKGTGWQKRGSLAYQLYDHVGRPTSQTKRLPAIPTWSFAASIVTPERRIFNTILNSPESRGETDRCVASRCSRNHIKVNG